METPIITHISAPNHITLHYLLTYLLLYLLTESQKPASTNSTARGNFWTFGEMLQFRIFGRILHWYDPCIIFLLLLLSVFKKLNMCPLTIVLPLILLTIFGQTPSPLPPTNNLIKELRPSKM